MNFIGVDLHKQSISFCVVNQNRTVLARKRLLCRDTDGILAFLEQWNEFGMVVEATASYEWFVKLTEPLARRVVLAHPQKMRVIAESTRKSDKLDAQILAEFLALDIIPASYRPTQRERDHRRLVRHRDAIQRRITSIKNRMRRIMSDYNADRSDLFSVQGQQSLIKFPFSEADRFAMDQLSLELTFKQDQLKQANRKLEEFAKRSPIRQQQQRKLLRSIPGVGFVTSEVVLAELADVDRFDSQKQVVSYAGLAPGQRESDGKSKQLHIEKTGSKHLRWILVEAAWQLVRYSPRWKNIYEKLKQRMGAKKAIIAISRRLLCLMIAVLKSGEPYSAVHANLSSDSANQSRSAPLAITST